MEKINVDWFDPELYKKLVEHRKWEVNPPYLMWRDDTLKFFAKYMPINKEEAIVAPRFWEYQYEKYWKWIIDIVMDFMLEKWIDVDDRPKVEYNLKNNGLINSKKYWDREKEYPGYVIVRLEWAFRTMRWKSAEVMHDIKWYKLWIISNNKITWCPKLYPILSALDKNKLKYIIISNNEIIEKEDYNEGTLGAVSEETILDNENECWMHKQKRLHENAYKKWTDDEDNQLIELYKWWKSIKELSKIFARNNWWIRARLKKLWLIEY